MNIVKMFVDKKISFIVFSGLLLYLIQLIFAIVFYKERILFIDMAFHSFEITNFKTFAIQNNRYGALLTQWLPVLAVKLSFPLKQVLIIYSCSFILLNLTVFWVLIVKFKNAGLSILLLCCHLLLTRDTFYWIQSELQQGISFFVLFLGYFFYLQEKNKIAFSQKILFLLFVFCLQFFHPILIIIQFFFIAFIYFFHKKNNKPLTILYAISLLVFIVLKFLLFKASSYDNEAIGKLTHLTRFFPDYFSLPIQGNLLHWLKTDYLPFVIFIASSSVYMAIHKQYKLLLLSLLSVLFYLLLITIMYYDNTPQFYFENLILPTVLFFCLPLLYYLQLQNTILPSFKYFFFFFAISLFFIGRNHTKFSDRLLWHQHYLASNTAAKLILDEKLVPTKDTLIMSWGVGYELVLLQALENKKITKTVLVVPNTIDYEKYASNQKIFIGIWHNYDYQKINTNYYLFTDTSSYKIKNE